MAYPKYNENKKLYQKYISKNHINFLQKQDNDFIYEIKFKHTNKPAPALILKTKEDLNNIDNCKIIFYIIPEDWNKSKLEINDLNNHISIISKKYINNSQPKYIPEKKTREVISNITTKHTNVFKQETTSTQPTNINTQTQINKFKIENINLQQQLKEKLMLIEELQQQIENLKNKKNKSKQTRGWQAKGYLRGVFNSNSLNTTLLLFDDINKKNTYLCKVKVLGRFREITVVTMHDLLNSLTNVKFYVHASELEKTIWKINDIDNQINVYFK